MNDCVTSQSRVARQRIAEVGHGRGSDHTLKARLLATTGSKLDFSNAIGNAVAADCSNMEKYLVQSTCARIKRRWPHFRWVAIDKDSAKVLTVAPPHCLSALACRAKARE